MGGDLSAVCGGELEDLARGTVPVARPASALPADPTASGPVEDTTPQSPPMEPAQYVDNAIAASKRYDCEGLR